MHSPFLPVESGLDIQQQAMRLGVSPWRTPAFLFIALGAVIVFLMLGVLVLFSGSENTEMIIVVEAGIAMFFLLFGGFMIRLFEEIAETRKTKNDFISTVSHKLKSPLAQIQWCIDFWKNENKTERAGKNSASEMMQKIEIANEQLIRMVDEFVLASRLESGEIFWHNELFDMAVLVRKICGRLQKDAEERGVHLVCEVLGEKNTLSGDARKIETILENIIFNALRYTNRSGNVSVYIQSRDKEIEVDVKDNGIGIPKESKEKVFQKFFRADNAILLNREGTGLGLYLCQKMMQKMGGHIRFESQENSGSTFFVVFPKK